MTLRANERGQIQKKPEQQTGDGENFGNAVDQQNGEDDHGEDESPFGGFLPKGLLPVGGVAFGGQAGAERREQARHRRKCLLSMCGTAEVVLGAANQAKIEKSLARGQKEKSRERRERAQAKGKEKIAEMAGTTEMAVGSIARDMSGRAVRLRRGIGASPSADCSSSSNEQGCDCEQRTFEKVRVRGVLDEGPDDVVGDEEIGEKGEANQEEMEKGLMAEFKVGGRHGYPYVDP